MRDSKIKRILKKTIPQKYEFTFYYAQKDYQDFLYYSDNYFLIPSTYLNKSLLTQSLSLTMSCFASGVHDYSSKFQNGFDLLQKLKFKDIEANSDYKNKPGADSLGIIFARKKIKRFTLVAAIIRSANYESEWASNFKVGDDKNSIYHKGFFEASEIYLESLKNYLFKNKIKGKIKLWTMGFSRGAISNNIASGRIDEMIDDNKFIFDKKIKLKKENLYSFCFESPRGVFYDETNYPKDKKFNNIFSILNYNDPVTKGVPRVLNCTTFGNEVYLPDYLNNFNFPSQLKKVISQYERMPNYSLLGKYSISDFSMVVDSRLSKLFAGKNKHLINWTQGLFLDDFIDLIGKSAVVSRENYTLLFQEGIRSVLLKYFSGELEDKSLTSALKSKDKSAESNSLTLFVKRIKQTLLQRKDLLFPFLDKNNLNSIMSAHSPELCLSFLRSMDKNYTNETITPDLSGRFYKFVIEEKKADFTIQVDSKDIIKYVKGERISNNNQFAQGIKNKNIEIYLPVDQKYSLIFNNQNINAYTLEVYHPNENKFIALNIEPVSTDNKLIINI